MKRVRAAAGSVAFLFVAPGVVAGLVPWLITRWEVDEELAWLPLQVLGGLLIAAGVAVLLHAFARFVVEGLGTPAPVAPTEKLVVGGLYRHVRNPMYVAVASTIIGQALVFGRPGSARVRRAVHGHGRGLRASLRGAHPHAPVR